VRGLDTGYEIPDTGCWMLDAVCHPDEYRDLPQERRIA